MDRPTPADGWQTRPLSETEAAALLGEIDDAVAVWVMDHGDDVQSAVTLGDGPDDAVVDIVVETETGFEMYSYTDGQWLDYGTQQKSDTDAPSMAGTSASYRVLAGRSDAH